MLRSIRRILVLMSVSVLLASQSTQRASRRVALRANGRVMNDWTRLSRSEIVPADEAVRPRDESQC
jgi:hypothetical protein